MYGGVTPEMAAMYGIPHYEPDPEPTDIDNAVRYCHACGSCEICKAADGCWLCGGPVTRDKPTYWPPRICATNVTQGEAFSPREEMGEGTHEASDASA